MTFITRQDMSILFEHSRMENAKEFRQWLFYGVLPSIEMSGGYILPEAMNEAKQSPNAFLDKLNQITDYIHERENKLEKNKVTSFDLTTLSKDVNDVYDNVTMLEEIRTVKTMMEDLLSMMKDNTSNVEIKINVKPTTPQPLIRFIDDEK